MNKQVKYFEHLSEYICSLVFVSFVIICFSLISSRSLQSKETREYLSLTWEEGLPKELKHLKR